MILQNAVIKTSALADAAEQLKTSTCRKAAELREALEGGPPGKGPRIDFPIGEKDVLDFLFFKGVKVDEDFGKVFGDPDGKLDD